VVDHVVGELHYKREKQEKIFIFCLFYISLSHRKVTLLRGVGDEIEGGYRGYLENHFTTSHIQGKP
jgi:hypothetical protein